MPSQFTTNFKKNLIVFICLLIVTLFIIFAYHSYPVPVGDSTFYIAPAVQFAANEKLISPLYPSDWIMDKIVDLSGAKRFLYYPPLFPLILSFLMPKATSQGSFLAIAILNVSVIILSAFLFHKVTTRKSVLTWSNFFLIVLALGAFVSSLGETGRPEILARLWIALGALVYFYISRKYDWLFFGVLLGLMFATHLAGGIFSIFVLGILFAVSLKPKEIILKGSGIFLIALFVFLSVIALGPFSVSETLGGIFRHTIALNHIVAQSTQKFLTFSNIFNYFIVSPTAPFYGLVVLLVFVAGIFFYRKYRQRIVSPRFVFLCAALLVCFLGKTVFLGHAFYPSLFAPLLFSILIFYFLEKGIFQKIAIVAVFIFVAMGIVRTVILFPFFIRQGSTLEQARAHFSELAKTYKNENVQFGITGGFWTITENYENVYTFALGEKIKENTAFIFFPQRYSGMLVPPEITGCNLNSDKFSREIPKIFGIKLANTMPGYGYAVYNCFNKP